MIDRSDPAIRDHLALDTRLTGPVLARRLGVLFDAARNHPIGLARLLEAHLDAHSIMVEGGRRVHDGAMYGVWASQHPTVGVAFHDGTLSGTMGFASGLGCIDRALVTASTGRGTILVDVDLDWTSDTIVADESTWQSPALTDTHTGSVEFAEHRVDASDIIDVPGWYQNRVGFWQGACAPAACWAGGVSGIVAAAIRLVDDDPHRRAHVGALAAHDWTLRSLLTAASAQIAADPHDRSTAERVARSLRFTVAEVGRDVLDRFSRAFGPRAVTTDADLARRCIDLDMYLRQHHSERELPAIADLNAPS